MPRTRHVPAEPAATVHLPRVKSRSFSRSPLSSGPRPYCTICHRRGHHKYKCWYRTGARSTTYCSYHHSRTHTTLACRARLRYCSYHHSKTHSTVHCRARRSNRHTNELTSGEDPYAMPRALHRRDRRAGRCGGQSNAPRYVPPLTSEQSPDSL